MTTLLALIPRTRRRASWWRRSALGLAAALALAWLGGFAWFASRVSAPALRAPAADGIVALTGGSDRIRAALLLLAAGRSRALLVTGIGGHAGLRALSREAGVDSEGFSSQVTLGRGATSTRGNAAEIAAWARQRGARSLIVVTAAYHMPRALVEIARALPGVTLYPAAVETPAGLRLLAVEYSKLIAAALDLTALAPRDPPRLEASS